MTPLAYQIVKQLTLPLRDRRIDDYGSILPHMSDIHTFDTRLANDLIETLAAQIVDDKTSQSFLATVRDFGFLPAPKTWIEFVEGSYRSGFLLTQDGNHLFVRHAFGAKDVTASLKGVVAMPARLAFFDEAPRLRSDYTWKFPDGTDVDRDAWVYSTAKIYAALALINSPRVIGRRQHAPHKGLERSLLAERQVIGRFPLHAWTEIILDCRPPQDLSDLPGYEAHLTGRKCLHFCRAHLRLRNGGVEFVRSHWRGDASLGIKRSRYIVQGGAA